MENTANAEIRQLLKKEKIPYWKIGYLLGTSEQTIYRKMRIELSARDKEKIMRAIERIKSEAD